MTSLASSLHPRLPGSAIPVSMFPMASRPSDIWGNLGLSIDQMHPVGEHILSARSDVPPGEWLVWVEHQFAMWIGGHSDALPAPVRRRLEHGETGDVATLLNGLADVGVWLREAALLVEGTWTPPRRADIVLLEVATRVVFALSGIFVDSAGRAARLEITRGGICWTDHPTLVVQWLLNAVDLPAPQ